MGSTLSVEQEPAPTNAKARQRGEVISMRVDHVAAIMNTLDDRLKKLESSLSKNVDNSEIVTASISKITLLETTLEELAKQITELEAKLDAVREAAAELKGLEPLDVAKVSQGVVDELSLRLRVGSDPVAQSMTNAHVPDAQATKMRRKRDL